MHNEEFTIEGRNAVIEAFRSGKTIDKLYVLEGCKDGPIQTVLREAKKKDTIVQFVKKDRLDQMSRTGKHQGVIAHAAAYEYSEIEDIFALAEKKGEVPFVIILDIHIILVPLSEQQIRQGLMVSLFQNVMQ